MTQDKVSEIAEETVVEAAPKKKKKLPIILGVVVVVLVAAGAGFWVWHEQPSFCNAICHTPMDPYNVTYDQEYGVEGIDKWGNTVADTSSMLAVSHKTFDTTCMGCHVPTLSEQISEGIGWVTGNYEVTENPTYGVVLYETSLEDLTAARGADPDSFCLNESCHNMTRDDLVAATDDLDFNPHAPQHGEIACSDCHKAHRASVMYCSQCHADAEVPEGWLTYSQAKQLAAKA